MMTGTSTHQGGRRGRPGSPHARVRNRTLGTRGMVTVELVFGILIISTMIAVFGWAILLFGVQVTCVDSAAAIARQAARGDDDAVARARTGMPRGATVQITTGAEEVHVTVRVTSRPLDFVPAVHLRAEATALREPGER